MFSLSILLTAFGSSNTRALATIFQDRFPNYRIVAVDSNPILELTPHPFVQKVHQVPKAKDKMYIKKILEICISEKIDFIIPVHDDEVLEVSKNQKLFQENGIHSFLSKIETLEVCRDKYLFYKVGKKQGLPIIETFLNPGKEYPIFIKPRIGNGSKNCFKINNKAEADVFQQRIKNPIFQNFENGRLMDVDFVADKDSNILLSIIKEELSTKDGIGVKVKICANKILEEALQKLVKSLKFVGIGAVEFFLSNENVKVIEMNIRPSSGIIFSYFAGADFMGTFLNAAGYEEVGVKSSLIKIGARMNRELKAYVLGNSQN